MKAKKVSAATVAEAVEAFIGLGVNQITKFGNDGEIMINFANTNGRMTIVATKCPDIGHHRFLRCTVETHGVSSVFEGEPIPLCDFFENSMGLRRVMARLIQKSVEGDGVTNHAGLMYGYIGS